MERFNLNNFYYVHSLSTHKYLKDILLNSISDFVENNCLVSEGQNISNTDWNIDSSLEREWFNIFIKNNGEEIIDIYQNIYKNLDVSNKNIEITNWWFQQYENNAYHGWHNHPESSFSNVYYLELPDQNEATELFSEGNNENITIDAKEGDLVIFPGYIPHRAKNTSNKRRTVLVFNCLINVKS